jgi:hypothetical protein
MCEKCYVVHLLIQLFSCIITLIEAQSLKMFRIEVFRKLNVTKKHETSELSTILHNDEFRDWIRLGRMMK